jgi:hypothetical protein
MSGLYQKLVLVVGLLVYFTSPFCASPAKKTENFFQKLYAALPQDENAVQKRSPGTDSIRQFPESEATKIWLSNRDATQLTQTLTTRAHMPFEVLEKLHIFAGTRSNPDRSLINWLAQSALGRHFSPFGFENAAIRFAFPLTDIQQLRNDQELVKFLAENPATAALIEQAFAKILEGQNCFFTYLAPKTLYDAFASRALYLPFFKRHNGNTAWLTAWRGLTWLGVAINILPPTLIDQVTNNIGEGVTAAWNAQGLGNKFIELFVKTPARIPGDIIHAEILRHKTSLYAYSFTPDNKPVRDPAKRHLLSLGDTPLSFVDGLKGLSIVDQQVSKETASAMANILLMQNVVGDLFRIKNLYNTITALQEEGAQFKHLQMRLMGIARILEGLTLIQSLRTAIPGVVFEQLTAHIDAFFTRIAPLKQLLKTPTFAGQQPSYFSWGPYILAAHKRMEQYCIKDFVPMLAHIGNLETLFAAAELYKRYTGTETPVCFVDFVAQDKPCAHLTNFWNPLLNADLGKIICNTLALGAGAAPNVIVTGPSGNGKSAACEGFATNLLLAQALTVTCAQQALYTPLDKIALFLEEQEDIAAGQSSGMAKQNKLRRIIDSVAYLLPGQKLLLLLDEPIGGSIVGDTAENMLYDALKSIAESVSHLLLLTTHFEKLTHLAEGTNGRFANKFVVVEEPSPGVFKRNYQLVDEPGNWFKDAQFRKDYLAWLERQNQNT